MNLDTMEELLDGIDLSLLDEDTSEGLGGLGAVKRKKKRSKSRRRKIKKARKTRKTKARKASRRRRRKQSVAGMPRTALGRFKKLGSAKPRRRRRRRATGMSSLSRSIGRMASQLAFSSLGKTKRKKTRKAKARKTRKTKKARKTRKVKSRRRGRKGRKSRKSRMSGIRLGSLMNASATLADAELTKSTPVIGAINWMLTKPGFEAIGGVTLASFMSGLVHGGLFAKVFKLNAEELDKPIVKVGGALLSAVAMWELGRAVGSGSIAKFGAAYAIGRLIEEELMKKQVLNRLQLMGLGQLRVPDEARFGQLRIPDETELIGLSQLRTPDDSSEGFSQGNIMTEEEFSDVGQFEVEETDEENVF